MCINASRMLNFVDEKYLCVGNGAAELINALGKILKGNMAVTTTVFNEYVRCFDSCNFNKIDLEKSNYQYDLDDINRSIDENDIVCIVNPDNPTGSFIGYNDMIMLLDKAKTLGKTIIFDESFIDFCNPDLKYTLISDEILEKYKNLIVIKSISKSYGIPGFRLGVLATSNKELIDLIKKEISVWNINSFAEYYLQIANLYKKDYDLACKKLFLERTRFIDELKNIDGIDVYDSEANFVMCNLNEYDSTGLAVDLLENDIFIKDLKTKDAFKGKNYIRLAVRSKEENDKLVKFMKKSINRG